MPHFHIPLQSGSDAVLAKMRRRYKREVFASRICQIKSTMPDACIGVDVIVGFPGETDADFEETYKFLVGLEPSYLHVFTYSERPNTHALSIKQAVPSSIRAERSARLHMLSDKLKRSFYKRFAGSTHTVLWETGDAGSGITGFTDNYIKVRAPYDPELTGELRRVRLTELDETSMLFDCAPAEAQGRPIVAELEFLGA